MILYIQKIDTLEIEKSRVQGILNDAIAMKATYEAQQQPYINLAYAITDNIKIERDDRVRWHLATLAFPLIANLDEVISACNAKLTQLSGEITYYQGLNRAYQAAAAQQAAAAAQSTASKAGATAAAAMGNAPVPASASVTKNSANAKATSGLKGVNRG